MQLSSDPLIESAYDKISQSVFLLAGVGIIYCIVAKKVV